MKMRTLIVDDEPLARERLRRFLEAEPTVEIVGEATEGREALGIIEELKPDLVFLDVQMPEMDGFSVIRDLESHGRIPPAVVFVTAFDQFAVKAFEVHAVDYLLKPFDAVRLSEALRRAQERIRRGQPADLASRVAAFLTEMKTREEAPGRLLVKTEGKVVVLAVEEIDWIESADNYVLLHVGKESHIQRETLSAMEGKLPSKVFIRISRSTIVNINRIKELQPLFHGEYTVVLRNGARLTLTRTYRENLDRLGMD
jgi:two-component system, LytTR family, response regulator